MCVGICSNHLSFCNNGNKKDFCSEQNRINIALAIIMAVGIVCACISICALAEVPSITAMVVAIEMTSLEIYFNLICGLAILAFGTGYFVYKYANIKDKATATYTLNPPQQNSSQFERLITPNSISYSGKCQISRA